MRTAFIFGFAFLLLGCNARTRQRALLTVDEAQKISVQLANSKASALYHCAPFANSQAAHFAQGRWVWTNRQGYGRGDIEVIVELAADGSTNSINFKLLDSGPLL